MDNQQIAARLVELNRAFDHKTAYQELFSQDAVSTENWSGTPESYAGLDAILAKGEAWEAGVAEFHSLVVGEPIISDSSIALTFTMDVTYKDENIGRQKMTELAIYTIKDGKIVAEEFRA
ncbi:MAG: hypothetical protein RLZZ70_432 [Candidatus Parcubacteria bacterium]|jgi:hypothetical protein